jgi:hypothetical protein
VGIRVGVEIFRGFWEGGGDEKRAPFQPVQHYLSWTPRSLSLSTLQTPLLLSLKQQTREMTILPLDSMVFTVQSLRE